MPGSKYKKKNAIFFADDNIIANRKFAKELFTALKPENINWMCQASINISREDELLGLMRDSGCGAVFIGFESITRENLGAMHKEINQRCDYAEAIKKIQSYGLLVHSSFIVGYDFDSAETINELIKFIDETNLSCPSSMCSRPFLEPSCSNGWKRKGGCCTRTGADMIPSMWFSACQLSSHELENGFRKIVTSIYSFDSIWKKLNYYWDIDFWKRSNELDPVKFVYRLIFALRLCSMLFSRNVARSKFILKILPRIFSRRVRISTILTMMAYNDFAYSLERVTIIGGQGR